MNKQEAYCSKCGETVKRMLCLALLETLGASVSGPPQTVCYYDDDGEPIEHDLIFPKLEKEED